MPGKSRKEQPPMPSKGASADQIKSWIGRCRAQYTPKQETEHQAAGVALEAVLVRLGFDPVTKKRLDPELRAPQT
jgi:hypothetical protein